MPKQWLGRVSVALSLVRAIYSYRRSQLPQRVRALQLLTRILLLTRQMFRPSPRSSEAWFVGGQMLGLALTILERRYPSQRPLVTRVGLLAQGTSMWLSRYVFEWYFGQRRQAMRARARPLDFLRRGRSRSG
jgi:hypothetical protein